MKLTVMPRTAQKKSETNKLRREGFIPAVIYHKGKAGEPVYVPSLEMSAFLRSVQPGRLPTSIFKLIDSKGKERRAIIKDIQYNIINYEVVHLDFEELHDDVPVNVKVPIECVGSADCAGIKLGGVLRQVIRHVKVRCYPKDIPTYFTLDIKDLALKQSKRLADIEMPNTVRPLTGLKEVVAVIVKR